MHLLTNSCLCLEFYIDWCESMPVRKSMPLERYYIKYFSNHRYNERYQLIQIVNQHGHKHNGMQYIEIVP